MSQHDKFEPLVLEDASSLAGQDVEPERVFDRDEVAYELKRRSDAASILATKVGVVVAHLNQLANDGRIDHDTTSKRFRSEFVRQLESRKNRRRITKRYL